MRSEQEIFDELAVLCTRPGYAHAIAFFCFRDHVVTFGDAVKADDYAKLFSNDRLIRTEIFTLIGLMLRAERDLTIPSADQLTSYITRTEQLLKELHEALNQPMMDHLKAAMGATDAAVVNPFANADVMREPIFYGAESAYSFQYRDISVLKYARDEAWMRREKGFSPLEAKQVSATISDFMNDKLLATLKSLRGLAPDQWTILPGFTFTAHEIAARSGLPQDIVSAVINAFACPEDGNPTFISLHQFNAANAYPIIRGENDTWIMFQFVGLTEALYETPFYWMAADKDYSPTAMGHRGLFTEEFTAERLRRVFGKDKVFQNVDIWETSAKKNKLGEIDVLVLIADRAVVVQAKSKRLTLAARRGNDRQLRSDFKGAVQDAYDQAYLSSRYVTEGSAFFADTAGNEVRIPQRLKQIHPICVVSDHYPALSFQASQFLQVKEDAVIKAPLVCDVFFVDVVTEFLESPLRCLSYLELRAAAGDNVSLSHETTALGYHLKRNLWLGEYDFMVLEDDLSVDVDIAMAARRDGIPGQVTPPGILTELRGTAVGRIIEQIENRADPGAVAIGLELLKLSGRSARDLSLGIDRIAATTAKDGKQHDVTIGSQGSGITVHCNSWPDIVAAPQLQRHCELRKYSQQARTWFGMTVEPGSGKLRFGLALDYPWTADKELDAAVAKMPRAQPVELLRKFAASYETGRRKVGRNERCYCGSGRKYKHCCLNTR